MKFSCTQQNLKQSMQTVTHVAGKNSNLPILSNVLIKIKNNLIQFIATDLEIGICHNMRGKIETEGMFTVNAKLLSDYIGLLPNKRVDVTLINNEVKINCENFNTKIKGEEATDYPVIPQIEKKDYYSFDFEVFKKAINKVIFSAATNETRMELSGVYFEFNQDKLTLAATDSYRLAEKKLKYKSKNSSVETKKLIIPTKTLLEVVRLSASIQDELSTTKQEYELKIYISDNQVLFTYDDSELVSRIIEGQYPDYQQIIPQAPTENKTVIIVNKQEILRAIKASSLFSKTNINDIHLDIPENKNKVVVSAVSGQSGESIIDVSASTKGKDNGVALNHKYLLDGLQNIDAEEIIIEIIDANTPCLIKAQGQDDYLYIIMPIKQ